MANKLIKSQLAYKNIYYMVAYCVEELKYFDESLIDYETLTGTHDLLAALLCRAFEYLYKSGCLRQYNKETIITDKPMGKIDIQKSKQLGVYQQGKLVCTVTKLNLDTELNRIVKAAFSALISSNNMIEDKINEKYLTLLDNYRMMLKGVGTLDLTEDVLNRNQDVPEQYKPVIVVSRLILNDWLAFDSEGKHRLLELNDEERLCRIWEKYLRNLIKKHTTDAEVSKPSYNFGTKNSRKNTGQPDIQVRSLKSKSIIVADAKWYTSNDTKGNEYQIIAYTNNCVYNNLDCKVHGILLYASQSTDENTVWEYEEENQPNMECHSCYIDINQDKESMEQDILNIVKQYI